MTENVGSIEYVASIDLTEFIRNQREVDTRLGRLEKSGDALATSFTKVVQAVKLYAAAMAVVKVAAMADDMRLLSARVDVVSGSMEAGARAWDALNAIGARTQTAVSDNVALYTRLSAAVKQLGGTQDDTLRATELVSKAIKVSGANAQEAAAAQLQFAQALGSGKLQGDELRSLLENAPYLMQQLASSIGVPVSALRKMGEEGELTSGRVMRALSEAADSIDADFKKLPPTIEGAMTVAKDAAGRAALQFDSLSGTSNVLTGALRGVGDVLDRLAMQFGEAADKSGDLSKNDAIQTWAKEVRTGLSYVVDIADVVWQALSVLGRNVAFVFKGIGTEIGGIGAQVALVMKGDFAGAKAVGEQMVAEAERRRKELDDSDAKTLSRTKLFGEQMREAWDKADAGGLNGGTRGGRGVTGADTRVQGTLGGGASDDAAKKFKFDADAYLQSLREANSKGLDLIDERERGELSKAQKLLADKKLGVVQYEMAVTEITAKANADRERFYEQDRDAALHAAEQKRKAIEDAGKAQEAADARAAAGQQQGVEFAQGIIGDGDPVARLQFELEAKSALLAQFAAQDMANEQLYAQAKIALEQQTQEAITAAVRDRREKEQAMQSMALQSYSGLFGSMAEIVGSFAGKQSGAYKAMFAVSKAFAIADSVMKIQQGIANALSLPWPMNLAAAASVAAQAVGIVSTIKGASFSGGRQYGGPVNAGSMYRVNEAGRPEMFTASSGEQYMLPTQRGKVTAADKIGQQAGSQRPHVSFGDVNFQPQVMPLPNGMWAVNPGDLADAVKRMHRDLFLMETTK